MQCSWCQKEIIRNLTLKEILWPFLIKERRCENCQQRLTVIKQPCCSTCCKPGLQDPCEDCLKWKERYPTYDFCHQALFDYDEAFKEWIHQYKFRGDYRLRSTFVPEIKNFFKGKEEDIICCIPVSKKRFEQRGLNQVEAIFVAANIKTVPLLSKIDDKDEIPQSQKNKIERLKTPQTFFATKWASEIKDKKVWIVDDVYTTGRTMFYAAQALISYNPKQIRTFSLAR